MTFKTQATPGQLTSVGLADLPAERCLNIGRKVPPRFEHLPIVPDERLPVTAELAHIRPVHFSQYRVQVDAIRQRCTVYDVHYIGQGVGDADQIALLRGGRTR